jgi:hypothetical protein
VRVYEPVAEIEALGVGINLQPNAVRELVELGLPERAYKRYERRKPLRYSLIARFCTIVGVSSDDMFRMVATQATTLVVVHRRHTLASSPEAAA